MSDPRNDERTVQETIDRFGLKVTDANGTPLSPYVCPNCEELHDGFIVRTRKVPSFSFRYPEDEEESVTAKILVNGSLHQEVQLFPGQSHLVLGDEVLFMQPPLPSFIPVWGGSVMILFFKDRDEQQLVESRTRLNQELVRFLESTRRVDQPDQLAEALINALTISTDSTPNEHFTFSFMDERTLKHFTEMRESMQEMLRDYFSHVPSMHMREETPSDLASPFSSLLNQFRERSKKYQA